ncbi:MAG: hypothetical protein E7417_00675 [Ruminococcaceae bacterium]|nr:hypothetical protein [Oscillospiraceae bacterium]
MKNATHRVVILKNLNSDIVSQAIFFLKEENAASESKIVAEAEKIVAKYMASSSAATITPQSNRHRDNIIKLICVALFSIGLAVTVAILS